MTRRAVFYRNMPSAESCFQKSLLVSRYLCFYIKKRPLYGLWASFLIKWTEVAPSSQDLAKKIHINSWRKKPISTKPLKFRSSNVQTQVAMKQKTDAYIYLWIVNTFWHVINDNSLNKVPKMLTIRWTILLKFITLHFTEGNAMWWG